MTKKGKQASPLKVLGTYVMPGLPRLKSVPAPYGPPPYRVMGEYKTAERLAAEKYRTLQCMALLKLEKEGRLDEVPDGPIDPAAVFTPDEPPPRGGGNRTGRNLSLTHPASAGSFQCNASPKHFPKHPPSRPPAPRAA